MMKYDYVAVDLIYSFCHCLVARFDFAWGDAEFHQETLENLQVAIKTTKKLCAVRFAVSCSGF